MDYTGTPTWSPDCKPASQNPIEIIYPNEGSRLFIPKTTAQKQEIVFQAAHESMDAKLFWNLNNRYVGESVDQHELALNLDSGHYQLTLLDMEGNSTSVNFRVIQGNKTE